MTKQWKFVADIGGTNARLGIMVENDFNQFYRQDYSVSEFTDFSEVVDEFLKQVAEHEQLENLPNQSCLAVATQVEGDIISFTNSHWSFSLSDLAASLDNKPLQVINDFEAVGLGIMHLDEEDLVQIGGQDAIKERPAVVLGPGTGFGVSTLVPAEEEVFVIDGEGGHADFAPVDEREIGILKFLTEEFGRVSVERLLSGDGLVNIGSALADANNSDSYQTPDQITEALEDNEPLAVEIMDVFFNVLGSTAGNLAITLGARGGVYIAGGIIPRVLEYFKKSGFRQRFEAKGRFADHLAAIPVYVVTRTDVGLLGAAVKIY